MLTCPLTSLRFHWNSATGCEWGKSVMFIYLFLFKFMKNDYYNKKLSIPLQWTLHQWRKYYFGFSCRKDKICVYSLNKKVNTGYLKSTKTKELGVWSFLYIWWFCMHNEWQYIAINFLLALYILNNLFLFMDYWITCKQGQTNYITDYCQAFLFILIYSMLEEIMLLSMRQCYTLLGYWQN